MSRTILVTGGAGYIGTHICVELLAAGFDVLAQYHAADERIPVQALVNGVRMLRRIIADGRH